MPNLDFVNNVADQVVSRQSAPPPQGEDKQTAVMQALQSVQPPLAPEQLQAVMQIISMLLQSEEQGEPAEPGEAPGM